MSTFPNSEVICKPGKERWGVVTVVVHDPVAWDSPPETQQCVVGEEKVWLEQRHAF